MFGLKIHMKDTACCTDMDAIFPMTVTTIAKDQEEAAKMEGVQEEVGRHQGWHR